MAAKTIKIRARATEGVTTVKALITHPMHTGLQKNEKTGELIPPEYIQEVFCEHKGKNVLTAYWGTGVSRNPYLSFRFKGGAKGETVKLSWKDNFGKSDWIETEIK
jgi:sulfur-oxidizing protein SoxZ